MKRFRFYCVFIAALTLSLWFEVFSVQETYGRNASTHEAPLCTLGAEAPHMDADGKTIVGWGKISCHADTMQQVFVDVQVQRFDTGTSQWVTERRKQDFTSNQPGHLVQVLVNCSFPGEAQYRDWVTGRYQDGFGWHDVAPAESDQVLTCP